MSDFKCFIKLRDCFQNGYTLPQFCIDNGIKRPLFLARKKDTQFIWNVHVQFSTDKRLTPQFCLLDLATSEVDFSAYAAVPPLKTQMFSKELVSRCDKLFFLSSDKDRFKMTKTIYLDDLTDYFVRKTYFELPLLSFLKRYPKVKLFVTNVPYLRLKRSVSTFTDRMLSLLLNVEDELPDTLRQIKDGKRLTAYQPDRYQNRIWFVGTCHQYGINVPCDKTIESYLQKMLNEANLPWRVESEAQFFFDHKVDFFLKLNELEPAPGDIIFVWLDNMLSDALPFFDIGNILIGGKAYRKLLSVKEHGTELLFNLMAENTFKFLMENNFFRDMEFEYCGVTPPPMRYGIPLPFEHWEANRLQELPPPIKTPFTPPPSVVAAFARAELPDEEEPDESDNAEADVQSPVETDNAEADVQSPVETDNAELDVQSPVETDNAKADVQSPAEPDNSELDVQSPAESDNSEADAQSPAESDNSEADAQSPAESDNAEVDTQSPDESDNAEVDTQSPAESDNAEVDTQSPAESDNAEVDVQSPDESDNSEVDVQSPDESDNSEVDVQSPDESDNAEADVQSPDESDNSEVDTQSPVETDNAELDVQSPAESDNAEVSK